MIRTMVMVVLAVVFVAGVRSPSYATQCGGDGAHGQEAAAAAGKETVVDIDNRICPVSGERIGQGGMEPATCVYEGTRYHFCCPACIDEFNKDPQQYIQRVEEELKLRESSS